MAKFRSGDLVLTSTQQIIQGSNTILHANGMGDFAILNVSGLSSLYSLRLNTGTTIYEFSTDGTLAGNSNNAVPTERAVKTYVDTQIGGLSTNHNSLIGLQGGDSTASEYYHLKQDIYDALYSASPLIGLGSQLGTNLEVDFGSNLITVDVNSSTVLNLQENIQTLGILTDTNISLNQSFNTVTIETNNNTSARFVNGNAELYYLNNQVFRTQSNGILIKDAANPGLTMNYSGGNFNIQNTAIGSSIIMRAKDALSIDQTLLEGDPDGALELYFGGSKVAETTANGITGAVWG